MYNFSAPLIRQAERAAKAAEFREKHVTEKIYPVPAAWKKRAYVTAESYKKTYAESVNNPDKFWAKEAKRLDWFKFPKKIKNTSFAYPDVSIKWFEDGLLNVSYN